MILGHDINSKLLRRRSIYSTSCDASTTRFALFPSADFVYLVIYIHIPYISDAFLRLTTTGYTLPYILSVQPLEHSFFANGEMLWALRVFTFPAINGQNTSARNLRSRLYLSEMHTKKHETILKTDSRIGTSECPDSRPHLLKVYNSWEGIVHAVDGEPMVLSVVVAVEVDNEIYMFNTKRNQEDLCGIWWIRATRNGNV